MATQTTQGTGQGSVERVFPKLLNGVVKPENLAIELKNMVFDVPQNYIGDNNYTLQLSDAGKHIYATDCTITVPYYTDVDFHIGTKIMIVTGGNSIVIEKDGVSQKIYSAGDDFEAYQVDSRSVVTLLMTNDDEWHLFGDNISEYSPG